MHGETQANRLASLMQNHKSVPSYELSLPLVTVRSSSLASLKAEEVLLIKQKKLECILLNNDTIVADVIVEKSQNRYVLKVRSLHKRKLPETQRKAHEVLKLSFGEVQSRILEVGHTIELTQIDLHKVILMRKNKIIAEASLITVDEEIAVQIDKVII